ncbi:hypothetical protein LF1_37190 [Rubripirellula obstinata]|uniref:16S ribosomal RNA methyltransferase KsgA/Dim1 family protein n=1 Tax=Rubripirellula obstinata TaxID=406547 RepID=A0A5B1CPG4_9BACT|nr:rRNA adenine N-6-methyltransferase family protein [Rubripirellula obstinata]KAA1261174.1 hypothetical protein LF1_37190 [Rubripirellula obstinata]
MNVSTPPQTIRPLSTRIGCVVKAFLRQPVQVATVVPSSSKLIGAIANRDCVRKASTVVELGPGAGGTTAGLLANMRPESTLLAIEKTQAFDQVLQEIADPRLRIEYADAMRMLEFLQDHELGLVDVVVSGIPFSTLPEQVGKRISQSVHEALRPGGTFIAYQVHNDVERYTRPLFGPSKTNGVLWNLPPLTVYSWVKVDIDDQAIAKT